MKHRISILVVAAALAFAGCGGTTADVRMGQYAKAECAPHDGVQNITVFDSSFLGITLTTYGVAICKDGYVDAGDSPWNPGEGR